MKKFIILVFTLLIGLTLVSCNKKDLVVTFDSQGGGTVESQTVKHGEYAVEPSEPSAPSDDVRFAGWFLDLESGASFEFETTQIKKNITLFAKWLEEGKVTLTFNTKVESVKVDAQVLLTGQEATTKPTDPVRAGYRFEGWYVTKPGYSWKDPHAFEFGETLEEDLTLHAYWEPVNSKNAVYTAGETYKVAIGSDSDHINPLTYTDSGQSGFISMLSGSMYTKEIDWDKAIADGIADFPGDFSHFSKADSTDGVPISELTYVYVQEMAANWPVDADGNDHALDGKIDNDMAAQVTSDEWTFTLKEGMKFDNGDPINSDAFEYTFKQYLDPEQLNSRSNGLTDSNYLYIKNASAYLDGEASWADVGFEKVDEYTFTTKHAGKITQKQALDMIDIVTLINETAYEAGFTGTDRRNNNYGSPSNPLVSYGPYVISEWAHNQKWLFKKNYDYVGKADVMYKAYEYQVIAEEDAREKMFSEGEINAFGLSANYYEKYVNDETLLSSPDAYTLSLSFNNDARTDGKKVPSIVGDHDFRMAVFHAIDRRDFAAAAAAPDVPTLGLLSDLHISAIENLAPYNASTYRQDVLNDPELNLSPETMGYLPEKAKDLFDDAYARWAVGENAGKKITLEFVSRAGSTYYELSAAYIKEVLEETFGKDRFEVKLSELSGDVYSNTLKAYNYDMAFNGMGGATHYGLYFTYLIFGQLAGPGATFEPGFDLDVLPLEFDFSEYAAELRSKGDDLEEYEDLFLNGGEVVVETSQGTYTDVVKGVDENGHWEGTLTEFATLAEHTIENSADFAMKHEVHYYAISVLEKAFLKVMATVPLTATAASTVYNDVFIDWPSYSLLFGWGSQKYRYLTSDPDFR